ncbi:glycogen synthase GlgA [Nitrosovibrio sp. Nv17]|uniref:glycogen synthase GlgA n=1 Tax=Nitrosovibrio sp. Nv17 TaxID=1855339 RepID=UPI00090868BF|nr:glycogen synthase GlgA [Nitrosovibrio sp. Nv17]SFW25062.1 starch synthase [Nitrosovibrio sp. Nv17]
MNQAPPHPRPRAPRVLFITPEVHPLAKTGGLGDVSAALPAALREMGVDVRLLIPGYPSVLDGIGHTRRVAAFDTLPPFPPSILRSARLSTGRRPMETPAYVIDCPVLYQRAGDPYVDAEGRDWPDNALRFGLLSRIGAILSSDASPLAWRPRVTHCNDWQSGLAPAYLDFHAGRKAATLMVIHNLAFQGIFPADTVAATGLPPASFRMDGVEYHGGMSFLKAGLYYADHIATVSPTYAREIQTPALGFGLHGLLAARRDRIIGIVNGIDTNEWNPATDPALPQRYTAATPEGKAASKQALQRTMGLHADPGIPLFGAVSRITPQKGYDLILEIAPQLIDLPAQLVILGSGATPLEQALTQLARNHPGRIAVRIGFDERLSHLIEAGADSFLMPSRFEPCGLNQMYSQRYGTPPIVRATGGLVDTVTDYSTPAALFANGASGFMFTEMTAASLLDAIRRAVAAYHDRPVWRRLMANGMSRDFGWHGSARAYRELYLSLQS